LLICDKGAIILDNLGAWHYDRRGYVNFTRNFVVLEWILGGGFLFYFLQTIYKLLTSRPKKNTSELVGINSSSTNNVATRVYFTWVFSSFIKIIDPLAQTKTSCNSQTIYMSRSYLETCKNVNIPDKVYRCTILTNTTFSCGL
jgi:hypothetical protein